MYIVHSHKKNCFPTQFYSNCDRNWRRWNSVRRLNYHHHRAASCWPTAGRHWAHHGCGLVPVSHNSSCLIRFRVAELVCSVFETCRKIFPFVKKDVLIQAILNPQGSLPNHRQCAGRLHWRRCSGASVT